jgi:hypothetical protein
MPSSGMCRRVALVRRVVSEDLIDSIIKVTRINELETRQQYEATEACCEELRSSET